MKRKKRIETLKNRIASSYITYFVDFICEDEIYFRNGKMELIPWRVLKIFIY